MGAVKQSQLEYFDLVGDVRTALCAVAGTDPDDESGIVDAIISDLGVTELCQFTKHIDYRTVQECIKRHLGRGDHHIVKAVVEPVRNAYWRYRDGGTRARFRSESRTPI